MQTVDYKGIRVTLMPCDRKWVSVFRYSLKGAFTVLEADDDQGALDLAKASIDCSESILGLENASISHTHLTIYLIEARYGLKEFSFFDERGVERPVTGSNGGLSLWKVRHDGTIEGKRRAFAELKETAQEKKQFEESIMSRNDITQAQKGNICANACWLTFSVIDKQDQVL